MIKTIKSVLRDDSIVHLMILAAAIALVGRGMNLKNTQSQERQGDVHQEIIHCRGFQCHLIGKKMRLSDSRAADLAAIPKISTSLARRIIQYAKETPVETFEKLLVVKGVSKKKLEILKSYIIF